jgi:hypothetical protein
MNTRNERQSVKKSDNGAALGAMFETMGQSISEISQMKKHLQFDVGQLEGMVIFVQS